MEQRLKERLTGAAILVALIVLIVPELFHGHLSERGGKLPSSTEGPPLRSYLIDLGGTHSSPMQLGAASGRALSAAPAVSTPNAVQPGAATAATASPVPESSSLPQANPQGAPVTHSSSTPTAMPSPSHHALATARSVARGNSSAAHEKAAADWSVQLGLYAKRSNAEHMVHVAHAKGFSASLTQPDAKGRYHVRVAGLTTRSAALTLAARLRAAGLPAAAVGPR